MKRAAKVLAVVVLCIAVHVALMAVWGVLPVVTWTYVVTGAISLYFIALFIREAWFKTMFGWSLMLLAVAILLSGVSITLYHFLGPLYPGWAVMTVATSEAALAAMALRTWVLRRAQRKDRNT